MKTIVRKEIGLENGVGKITRPSDIIFLDNGESASTNPVLSRNLNMLILIMFIKHAYVSTILIKQIV